MKKLFFILGLFLFLLGPGSLGTTGEDCLSFNPNTIQVKFINSHWKIVDGSHWMFDFGNKKDEALMAYNIIKHYKMNQSCFVGRPDPSFEYLLVSGEAPVGEYQGEDCMSFNPETIQVKLINGRYKIVDGNHWIFDFAEKKNEAYQAYKIIKKYGFSKSCYVGRPNASFKYLKKAGISIITPPPVFIDNCKRVYPKPRIKFERSDSLGRIYIPVLNWKSYSNSMFRKAPELPPCGSNTKSSRTWVDIYNAETNKRVYGFCAFDSNDDLKKIWFSKWGMSGKVYIIINDRACKKSYRSNTVKWTSLKIMKRVIKK